MDGDSNIALCMTICFAGIKKRNNLNCTRAYSLASVVIQAENNFFHVKTNIWINSFRVALTHFSQNRKRGICAVFECVKIFTQKKWFLFFFFCSPVIRLYDSLIFDTSFIWNSNTRQKLRGFSGMLCAVTFEKFLFTFSILEVYIYLFIYLFTLFFCSVKKNIYNRLKMLCT
jgi:hypothetical protein